MNSRLFLLVAALAALILTSGCTSQSQSDSGRQSETVLLTFRVYLPEGAVEKSATVGAGSNALDAMDSLFELGYTEYVGIGKFVTSIEGIPAAQGEYWALYVDGKYADRGISLYYPESDTLFEWKLERLE